jgi:hypothetical protein
MRYVVQNTRENGVVIDAALSASSFHHKQDTIFPGDYGQAHALQIV